VLAVQEQQWVEVQVLMAQTVYFLLLLLQEEEEAVPEILRQVI
jgi:hypothetical protein